MSLKDQYVGTWAIYFSSTVHEYTFFPVFCSFFLRRPYFSTRFLIVDRCVSPGVIEVNQPNAQGLTPLAAATQNRQEATMQVLKAHGAQA